MSVLNEKDIWKKLASLDDRIQGALSQGRGETIPEIPGRDVTYLPIQYVNGRMGLGSLEGQQKLLHDLANIELQAMELGLRTLYEFPWAHASFKEKLVEVIKQEAKHLKLCLQALESLGGYWGKWPVHLGLWHATHPKDSLLERIFIVHRYLEGSGLDAGDSLLRKLSGIKNPIVKEVVQVIVEEEVGHVEFGSQWFKHYAQEFKVDDKEFFKRLCEKLMRRHPRKDKISVDLRIQAQFSDFEISHLQELRLS